MVGSAVDGFFWVTKQIRRLELKAALIAAVDFSLPKVRMASVWGRTTPVRKGTKGATLVSLALLESLNKIAILAI